MRDIALTKSFVVPGTMPLGRLRKDIVIILQLKLKLIEKNYKIMSQTS